jgi:replication factor C subunit 1
MIISFGGHVTGSVSGRTTLLVVGKEPGASKVKKATERNIPLLDLNAIVQVIEGKAVEATERAQIESFSSGCRFCC